MKMVKSLVLGSAAGLLALSGAQAADLPVKAKAVEDVRICSLYGAGFFYIPGTDTCIKLGVYLRADTTFNGGSQDQPACNPYLVQQQRYHDYFAAPSRMAFTLDYLTATSVSNIQYTADFGAGVSASIGLDDPTVWNRTALYNLSTGLNAVGTTGNAYGGTHAPDIVGRIRVDQAWGLFQVSAAAHEVGASYNTLTASTAAPTSLSEIGGPPETK